MKTIEERREYMRLYMKRRRKESPEFKERCKVNSLASRLRHADKAKQRNLKWKEANKEHISAYNKKYAMEHVEDIANRAAINKKKNVKRDHKKNREWVENNRLKVRAYTKEYAKQRTMTDPSFHLKTKVRGRISSALAGKAKKAKSEILLGCSYAFFKTYIESLFVDGMTWANRKEWHVDHIVPLASFDLLDEAQQKQAFHYTNQQPLWKIDNLKKGAKMNWMRENRV